ncbi:hypothetical protein KKC08_05675 [Patescibacteria group bacterium]|nr:hypothetical protein [Patescibacteria group bacterium]MBU4210454.1 hypothetical protein [Patescibacteria group bacterium]MBU4397624.1 hypothetical protein [Patescibacteria group bacterium]MBU4579258.1 hypothetical protein [Patescibacteria group bacterium]MCG2701522.1 hypothetical protein [Candidatus Parcubacteria bacterium]
MLKELLLAILLGSVIGFAVTGGIWNFKNKTNKDTVRPTPATNQTSPAISQSNNTPTPKSTHFLDINNPENESVTNKGKTTLSGKTTPNSIIAIKSTIDSFFTTADKDGNFSQNIELEGGINLIQTSSIDSNENQVDAEVIITYSTAKF